MLTDNRNRISADVRQVFSKLGGSMAEPGAVGWQFSRKGVIITADGLAEDDVMLAALDAGADDIVAEGEAWRITTSPSDVFDVQEKLDEAGIETLSADSPMVAENLVAVTEVKDAKAILRILEALEDNDDVQDVYANFDISDELMEEAAAG